MVNDESMDLPAGDETPGGLLSGLNELLEVDDGIKHHDPHMLQSSVQARSHAKCPSAICVMVGLLSPTGL